MDINLHRRGSLFVFMIVLLLINGCYAKCYMKRDDQGLPGMDWKKYKWK